MKFARRARQEVEINLTPLIDVVFLLLIFFMVSTTFVNEPAGLQVELPRSENRELIPEGSDVALVLRADGQIELEGEAVDLAKLKSSLSRIARDEPSTVVVLRADKSLEHGRVVQVMDLVRTLGLPHFAIATDAASPRR